MIPKRVLVAIKPGERDLPLTAVHARRLAENLGGELTLVTCVFDPLIEFELERAQASAPAAQAAVIQTARDTLEDLALSLPDSRVRAHTKVIWDRSVSHGLLREVRESRADLLVVGAHEPKALTHTPLMDADRELMRLCPSPLLIVKGPRTEGYRTILAAIDPLHRHSEPSGLDRAVLTTTREIGHAFGVPWRVVHVFPDAASFSVVSSVEVLPGVFYGAENVEYVHRRAVQELVGEYGVTPDRIELRPGEPAEVISETAREGGSELVVLGAVKRGRLAAALLGSTAERVVAEVDCDVLLVPPPAALG